jgi:hypothetical protein
MGRMVTLFRAQDDRLRSGGAHPAPLLLLLELHAHAMDLQLHPDVEGNQQRHDGPEQRARGSQRQRQEHDGDHVAHVKTYTTMRVASRADRARCGASAETIRAARSSAARSAAVSNAA